MFAQLQWVKLQRSVKILVIKLIGFRPVAQLLGGRISKSFARQNYFQLEKYVCPVAVGETAEVTEALGYNDNRFQASSTVTGR